jgi:2-oxoglutarate dehydrogenase E1 component
MKNLSVANRWNADLIDEKYEQWLHSPETLGADWKAFFEGFELGQTKSAAPSSPSASGEDAIQQAHILAAIDRYRALGHLQAKINPLDPSPEKTERLTLASLKLSESDLNKEFYTGNYLGGKTLKGKTIIEQLDKTYCGAVGYEFKHIQDVGKRHWLQNKIEACQSTPNYSHKQKLRLLKKVNEAEAFEHFLHTRYVGQKRFSLEGGETLVASLDAMIELCPEYGIKAVVMGMPHRGRLNVLANILKKPYEYIFREFSSNFIPDTMYGDGDVKYHLGFECVHSTEAGQNVEIYLAANPSHLEAVDPVVQGRARARQRILGDVKRKQVLPVLLHGDAAMIGQGVIAEVFNLSRLKGYTTGGTLHFVVNNQIGFTTNPSESRSSRYCTDVAKMIEIPIFHVNGDDPEAMAMVTELAIAYRQEFGDDVVIDMYCYRKHGHNETDEPVFTQPTLYKQISAHPPVSEVMSKKLLEAGEISPEECEALRKAFYDILHNAFTNVQKEEEKQAKQTPKKTNATPPQPAFSFNPVKTAVSATELKFTAEAVTRFPQSFQINSKIKRQLEAKHKALNDGEGIDWGFAETLAYGTLLREGTPVRLSGQDCERGTFSHRHAVFYDTETRERYVPLLNLSEGQAEFCVHNSSLSELSVLGFDYGYSLDFPQMLCIWEAQFGDFANGAQVIIDQFITSSESKWKSLSGLVMLLPHGYEGQGPEHSSARLERYLQACAADNIQVCNITTPAQLFHVLRRQMKRNFRKPLVIMSPKSLLRHKECVSTVTDLTKGTFEEILDDQHAPKKVDRIVVCSGKVYYDLLNERREQAIKGTAILRLEQLYPLHKERLRELFAKYKGFKHLVWCQEEPQNMGAWSFIAHQLEEITNMKPKYAGRKAAASPAVGALAIHKKEQAELLNTAFHI